MVAPTVIRAPHRGKVYWYKNSRRVFPQHVHHPTRWDFPSVLPLIKKYWGTHTSLARRMERIERGGHEKPFCKWSNVTEMFSYWKTGRYLPSQRYALLLIAAIVEAETERRRKANEES